MPLLEAGVHGAGERHLPVLHRHLDVRRIDVGIVGQPVVHIIPDAFVRARVALWTASAVAPAT
jgi:hypothetical protein